MTPRQIGDALMARAGEYPPEHTLPSRSGSRSSALLLAPRAEFVIDGLKISCPATFESVAAMARRFQKAPACLYRPERPRLASLRRPKDADALMAALEDRRPVNGFDDETRVTA